MGACLFLLFRMAAGPGCYRYQLRLLCRDFFAHMLNDQQRSTESMLAVCLSNFVIEKTDLLPVEKVCTRSADATEIVFTCVVDRELHVSERELFVSRVEDFLEGWWQGVGVMMERSFHSALRTHLAVSLD